MTENPFHDIPHYVRVFQTYLGARIYLILALAFIATLSEAFGLLLVLPLLINLGIAGPNSQSAVIHALLDFLNKTGILESTSYLLLIIATAFVTKGLLMFCALSVNAYLRAELLRTLKLRLFEDYSQMSREYYSCRDSGHFINVINDQITSLLDAFKYLTLAGSQLLMSLAYLGLILIISWQFGLMALVFGGTMLWMFKRLSKSVRRLSRQTTKENGKLTQLLIQFIHSLQYLKSTDQIQPFRTKIEGSIAQLTDHEMCHGMADGFTKASREPILLVFLVAILWIQIYVIGQPIVSLLVAIMTTHRALNATLSVQHNWVLALTHIGGVEVVNNEFLILEKNRDSGGNRPVGDLITGIELQHVDFRHEVSKGPTLTDISLYIPSRRSVALIGPSGAGKTTIVDLITLELKPTRGQVLIEGISGEHVQLTSWRRKIGYVPQVPTVFDDTIANNICMWAGDPVQDRELQERIRIAASKAHIDHFVQCLPEGYQTNVGDRGLRLSGGQRQRICIARELFREPQLLILDEATSALDSESEHLIQQSIRDLHGYITVLIVSHRLSTIRDVDQIYVIDDGRVVQHGTYQELIESKGSRFCELTARQGM